MLKTPLTTPNRTGILSANQGAYRALETQQTRPAEPGRNGEREMNVWHDDGDDGVTGWQPIGEPLIRTTRDNSGAQPETNNPAPGGKTGQKGLRP